MQRPILFLSVLGALALSWASAEAQPGPDRPKHPLLEKLEPPPVNLPRPGTPIPPPKGEPALPPGTRSALVIVSDGRALRGVVSREGRLVARPGQMTLTAEGQPAIEMRYRLPDGLQPPPERDEQGALQLVERSGAAGPDRRLVLRAGSALLLAQIWVASRSPVTADLGDGLQVVQRAAAPAVEPVIEVLEAGRPLGRLSRSKPLPIKSRTGVLHAMVETSRLTSSAEPGDPRRYILKVWLVRERSDPANAR